MKTAFWISTAIVLYTFIGYAILLYILIRIKRTFKRPMPKSPAQHEIPTLTLVVAAYNEAVVMEEKIRNTLSLDYPANKLQFLFVTSGSSDATPAIVARHPSIRHIHSPERRGKIHAVHTAMQVVRTDLVVFTDANTFLNREALIRIAARYAEPAVGAVSGEKRVQTTGVDDATAGEGFYWKYESALKRWDSELYSVVGAAGELFSIRTHLYSPVPPDTVLDDFMLSMNIASRGYRIVYEPEAYAVEGPSANVGEEWKRKVRIAAGGIQSILRLKPLLNPFRNPVLAFQYISHRVLRWTVTPLCMVLALVSSIILTARGDGWIYSAAAMAQSAFYLAAFGGYIGDKLHQKIKALFVPYYFCMMNAAVVAGILRYAAGKQSAVWEKARRKDVSGE